jgi:DNA-binding transcriptional ArsR family regulator
MNCIQHPPEESIRLDSVLSALGDPVRLKIVETLNRGMDQPCCSVVEGLDLPKSTQSYHFRILREAGVIRTHKSGIYYLNSLRREELDRLFPGLLDAVLTAHAARQG